MPDRELPATVKDGWKSLANLFENILGGSESSRKAASYLRALANAQLPPNEIPPLRWHADPLPPQVVVEAREEPPHPVVLATLSPSIPLRAVWKRR